MGRKRIVEIEKEENRKIAEMVLKVIGDRSYKDAAIDAGVDPSTLSYICRGKVKPTPDILVKLTEESAHPQGGVGLEELMITCGYQTDSVRRLMKYAEAYINSEQGGNDVKTSDSGDANVFNEVNKEYMKYNNSLRRALMQLMIDKGISILSNQTRPAAEFPVVRFDSLFEIANTGTNIKNWIFYFDIDTRKRSGVHTVGYAKYVFGTILLGGLVDEKTKVTFITLDKRLLEALAKYKDELPYRGEFSVMNYDVDSDVITDEVYLSNYICGDKSQEFYIV